VVGVELYVNEVYAEYGLHEHVAVEIEQPLVLWNMLIFQIFDDIDLSFLNHFAVH
jgi:hypothetical protein